VIPPRPERGVVSWNVNTACNYRCSYCTQRFLEDRGRWARDVPRFVAAFARLPGSWEIKLSGGEPFVHPDFLALVRGLANAGILISVVTNFSAKREVLAGFLEAARGQAGGSGSGVGVGVFSASLHLGYVACEGEDVDTRKPDTLADFVARGCFVRDELAGSEHGSFCVTCVATRENLPRLPSLQRTFAAAGLTFKIQPEKQDRDVIAYTAAEESKLLVLGGHNGTGVIRHHFKGQPCWAGARYLIVDDRGEAYRCYPARRGRREHLGNILSEDFRLRSEAQPCLYDYCNCTVPIERNMMARPTVAPHATEPSLAPELP